MENKKCDSEGCKIERRCNGHIEGIHCDVTNCVFNEKDHKCTASQIQVGPFFAATSDETACVTFKQKKD